MTVSVIYHIQMDLSVNVREIFHDGDESAVYIHRPNAFGFWQMRLHLCYETLKRISNFSELA